MKIKKGFVLREVANNYVVVAVGEASKNFNGIINLNETGAFLWNHLLNNITKEELINIMLDEYDVDKDTVKKDIEDFLGKLESVNLLE